MLCFFLAQIFNQLLYNQPARQPEFFDKLNLADTFSLPYAEHVPTEIILLQQRIISFLLYASVSDDHSNEIQLFINALVLKCTNVRIRLYNLWEVIYA